MIHRSVNSQIKGNKKTKTNYVNAIKIRPTIQDYGQLSMQVFFSGHALEQNNYFP